MIVQGGLIKPITAWLGERRTLLFGLLCGAVGFAIYGLAPTGSLYWSGIPVMAFWGLAGPAAQGLMTRRVGPMEQGQLQGAIASLGGCRHGWTDPLHPNLCDIYRTTRGLAPARGAVSPRVSRTAARDGGQLAGHDVGRTHRS